MPLNGAAKKIFLFFVITVTYFSIGILSLKLATINHSTSPFWPASGVAIATILLFGKYFSPAIFIGAFLTNMMTGGSLLAAIGIAAGNCSEALLGAYLITSFYKKKTFNAYSEVFSILIASALACALSATIGVVVLFFSGAVPSGEIPYAWLTWWGGDLIGAMVFVPFIMSATEFRQLLKKNNLLKWSEFFVYCTLIYIVNREVFLGHWEVGTYWINCLIFLISTIRLGTLSTRTLLVTTCLLAIFYTIQGNGPFEFGSRNINLLYLQSVIACFSIVVLFIPALLSEAKTKTIFGILIAGLLFIIASVSLISSNEKGQVNKEFKTLVEHALLNLKKAEMRYSMLLKSGAGMLAVYPKTDKHDWFKYVSTLSLEENYKEINGFGVVLSIPKKSINAFAHKFKVHSLDNLFSEKFNDSFPITFVEPIAKNKGAIGLDLGSEPNRRESAELARDTREVVATKSIRLIQDETNRSAFLIYYPVWVRDSDNKSNENFFGWTYAPVFSEVFFNSALKSLSDQLLINLTSEKKKIYELGNMKLTDFNHSNFQIRQEIEIFKIKYTLNIYPTEEFFSKNKNFPIIIGIFLTILLMLLAAIFTNISSFTSRLELLVKQRTEELDVERLKSLQNAKLASLGEMSAGVAHEINNPLAIISGSVGLMPKYINDPDKFAAKITAIEKSCERISKIVGGLRKFSRTSGRQVYTHCSLNNILNDSVVLTEINAKRNNTLISYARRADFQILCNEVEIQQVFINLINNSIDAVKSQNKKWIKITMFDDAGSIVVRVTDSGPGISEEVQDKIFNPFFTTKPTDEGTGLGLSISKGILDEHKATISVLSKLSNTCFEVRFPKITAVKLTA